jgi:hypothetical protein
MREKGRGGSKGLDRMNRIYRMGVGKELLSAGFSIECSGLVVTEREF